MNTKQKLLTAGATLTAVFSVGCIVPAYEPGPYGRYGPYDGPYSGAYGTHYPYDEGPYFGGYGTEIIVGGRFHGQRGFARSHMGQRR